MGRPTPTAAARSDPAPAHTPRRIDPSRSRPPRLPFFLLRRARPLRQALPRTPSSPLSTSTAPTPTRAPVPSGPNASSTQPRVSAASATRHTGCSPPRSPVPPRPAPAARSFSAACSTGAGAHAQGSLAGKHRGSAKRRPNRDRLRRLVGSGASLGCTCWLLAMRHAPRGRSRVAASPVPLRDCPLPLITQASPMAEASELPTLAAARTIVHKDLAGAEPVQDEQK